jgi:hypothetical protein
MVESCLPMREPGTGAIGVPDQRKGESGCLVHAGQGVPEVKDDREAKHLHVELGTDTKVRDSQTDVVYSTEGQARVVGSCHRFVRLRTMDAESFPRSGPQRITCGCRWCGGQVKGG